MTPHEDSRPLDALRRALDEARFGASRTLNLRESLPTPEQATRRAESWLRQQQVEGVTEVLVITGRGNHSPGGVSVVREAVSRLLASLRRAGVVQETREHTAGSFIVTLAPMRSVLAAPRRRRPTPMPIRADPPALRALDPETRELLRTLAGRSLEALGIHGVDAFVEEEMLRQFGILAAGVPEGSDREERLRAAIARALDEITDRD